MSEANKHSTENCWSFVAWFIKAEIEELTKLALSKAVRLEYRSN